MTQHDAVEKAAAEWLTRLQDRDVSLEDTLQWQRWIGADASHATAFERIEAVWEQPWELLRDSAMDRHRLRSLRWAIAAAVSALAIALSWALWSNASVESLQTRIGETRSLQLADGSRVILGGRTQIRVSLGSHSRQIDLLRGEAFFAVAKDPARPFEVHAGNATVTAVGTEFNVRRGSDRVLVAVIEGRVVVAPEQNQNKVPLEAGQQTVVDRKGIESSQKLVDTAAATAWQSGRLVFRREPLRYVIEDVNRYASRPIVLEDARNGDIRITGTVLTGSVDGWVKSLENAFALTAVEQPDKIVLKRAK
jgi:transmembrane sensor